MKGQSIFGIQDAPQGPVVQLGRTSPSRGEDHRFKSGPAHFHFLRSGMGSVHYSFFIFPNQTGTATSSPNESNTVPVSLGFW